MSKRKNTNKLPGTSLVSKLVLWLLIKPYLFLITKVFHRVRFVKNGFEIPKGPVFFIGNHHTNWDGFYQSVMLYWRFPHFLVTDEVFRNKFARFIFGDLLGQISRREDKMDREPYLIMKRLIRKGKSISIFPEGDIDMFGRSLNVDESIAKLAKFLALPIILFKIEGGHLRYPRWRYKPYCQRNIKYRITDYIPYDEMENLSLTDLHRRIVDGIASNEYDYQDIHHIKVGNLFNRAKWLELGLFLCPECLRFNTLHSHGNNLKCDSCGQSVHVDRRVCLSYQGKNFYHRPDKFDDFQKAFLSSYMDGKSEDEILFSLENGSYEYTENDAYFSYQGKKCRAEISKTRLIIREDNEVREFEFSQIINVRLQHKQILEIWMGGVKYRLWSSHRPWSAYMWVILIEIAKQNVYNNLSINKGKTS